MRQLWLIRGSEAISFQDSTIMSTLHGGNADSVMLAALFCATSILGKMEAIGILPLVGDLTTPSNKHGDIRVIKINPDGF